MNVERDRDYATKVGHSSANSTIDQSGGVLAPRRFQQIEKRSKYIIRKQSNKV